jgi:NAD(P)-dependent dehydrogenase (short-subunit alcohol dehydrogenase family)
MGDGNESNDPSSIEVTTPEDADDDQRGSDADAAASAETAGEDRATDETTADEETDHDRERVVLLTGAGSGIGAATAERFHDAGWTVWATDLDADLLADLPAGVCTAALDVTDGADRERVVARVVDEHGRLDCLVNNAGYAVAGPVEDVPVERAREQFDVLVHGPHGLLRESLPHLRESGGTAVTVTSVLGRAALPGVGVYAAAKFAAEGLTDALRMELTDTAADAVAVEPAWVRTSFEATADEGLDDRDRTAAYADVYDRYDGGLLDGGPLSVGPDRVAETVLEAAEATDPATRYPVGTVAQAVAATRYLPDPLADRLKLAGSKVVVALS